MRKQKTGGNLFKEEKKTHHVIALNMDNSTAYYSPLFTKEEAEQTALVWRSLTDNLGLKKYKVFLSTQVR